MSGIKGALCILVLSCSTLANAENFLAHVNSQEVQQQVNVQLRTLLGQGDAASVARLERLQSQLRPLYSAMPKDASGGLDHGTARYALHRFFAQQHGWHVRGLEVTGAEQWSDAADSTTMLEDHIPSYVLQLFERQHGGRTGLRELAVLAATLEDVVHSEAIQLLSSAYVAQGQSLEAGLQGAVEHRIITTYLLFHTLPDPDYADLDTENMNYVLEHAPTFWSAWLGMVMWVQDLRDAMDYDESSRRNPFVDKVARSRDFNSVVRLVEGLGENYGKFQNLECREMKNALLDLSDGSGRVRLAKFYKADLENRTTHFSESPDYLRHLGVLDETDPRQPSVIVTNYLYARTNCVASSSLYSICCIDDCDALLAGLEKSIAQPVADPQKVAEIVASMSSDTVSAPRNLSVTLRRRLDDIAGHHGGSVPLHGRLFAQWMHHAFPNECAYPHMTGSLDSPLSSLDVLLAENETGLHLKATKEEMQSFVDAALRLNTSDPLAAVQEPALPWTEEEELMVGLPVAVPRGKAASWLRLAAPVVAIFSAALGFIRMLGASPASALPSKAGKGGSWPHALGSAQSAQQCWV